MNVGSDDVGKVEVAEKKKRKEKRVEKMWKKGAKEEKEKRGSGET